MDLLFVFFFCVMCLTIGYAFGYKKKNSKKVICVEENHKDNKKLKPKNIFSSDSIELTEEFLKVLLLNIH